MGRKDYLIAEFEQSEVYSELFNRAIRVIDEKEFSLLDGEELTSTLDESFEQHEIKEVDGNMKVVLTKQEDRGYGMIASCTFDDGEIVSAKLNIGCQPGQLSGRGIIVSYDGNDEYTESRWVS